MFVMHGGAGTITRQNMTPDMEKQYREKLEEALRTGHAILAKGGSSLDAVETSIRILEERSPASRSSMHSCHGAAPTVFNFSYESWRYQR